MNLNEEILARRVLEAVSEVKELFRKHAIAVDRLKSVSRTLEAVEVIKYQSGTMLEAYAEAELRDGTFVSWLMDGNWTEDSWAIEAELAGTSHGEQETLQKLPAVRVESVDEFLEALIEVAGKLLELRSPALGPF
jgi:hypothetical protein